MSVNAPTPSGQRSRQMQTTTLEKTEAKREVSHRHDQLDVLSDDLLGIYAYKERFSSELARRLNERRERPVWMPGQAQADEVMLTEAHVAAIVRSDLGVAQLWALQQRKQRQALAMSRIIGILHGIPIDYVNKLAHTSFLLDNYVASTWHRAMSRISGAAIRWAERFGNAQTQDDLAAAFEQLERGQPGTQVVLTNIHENGQVRLDVFISRVNPIQQRQVAS